MLLLIFRVLYSNFKCDKINSYSRLKQASKQFCSSRFSHEKITTKINLNITIKINRSKNNFKIIFVKLNFFVWGTITFLSGFIKIIQSFEGCGFL